MGQPDKSDWPIIHLYGPNMPHGEQIIACNARGLQALLELLAWEHSPMKTIRDDGEHADLFLVVTEETGNLPTPLIGAPWVHGEREEYEPDKWAWLIARCRELLGLDPQTGLPPETPWAAGNAADGVHVTNALANDPGATSRDVGLSGAGGGERS